MDDNRHFKRFPYSFSVQLKPTADASVCHTAPVVDLSFTGIGVLVEGPHAIGDTFTIDVQDTDLDSEAMVIGQGEITHVGDSDLQPGYPLKIGIRFTSFDEKVLQALMQRLRSRDQMEARRQARRATKKTNMWQ